MEEESQLIPLGRLYLLTKLVNLVIKLKKVLYCKLIMHVLLFIMKFAVEEF